MIRINPHENLVILLSDQQTNQKQTNEVKTLHVTSFGGDD